MGPTETGDPSPPAAGGTGPGLHPEPPTDLHQQPLPTRTTDGPWFRVHKQARDPAHFGRATRFRFDDPAGDFGVLYLASCPRGAFIETFGHSTAGAPRVVTAHALKARLLSRVDFEPTLRLVDLTGAGLARVGADARLCTGDYRVAQRWSAALAAHPATPDGLLYRSRHDPSRLCAAVFERASDRLTSTPVGCLMAPPHQRLLATLLDHYDFGLLD
jgi:hypothetical protein